MSVVDKVALRNKREMLLRMYDAGKLTHIELKKEYELLTMEDRVQRGVILSSKQEVELAIKLAKEKKEDYKRWKNFGLLDKDIAEKLNCSLNTLKEMKKILKEEEGTARKKTKGKRKEK